MKNKRKILSIVIILLLIAHDIITPQITLAAPAAPELPRIYLSTTYPTLASTRTIFNVDPTCFGKTNCSSSLQTAIDAAKPGDEIIVTAGMQITGPIFLRNKTTGDSWIVIRTSRMSDLPPEGSRVSLQHAVLMPKIVSPGFNQSALVTEKKAHNYRIVGIEFAKINPSAAETNLIALGEFEATLLSDVARDIVLDRVYAHGDPTSNLRRCIALNSASTAIIDSYISDCHEVGADSQAIGGWNGPGPYKITNNYLEGAGENILFGGTDPKISNLISTDIEIRGNYIYKPLSWKIGDLAYAGKAWTVKNSFELKNAQRVLVQGNIFQHNWEHGQSGISIVFTPRNQDGGCPWCIVSDVTFQDNIIESVGGGFNLLGYDDINTSRQTARISIKNNLLLDLDRAKWGGNGLGFQSSEVADLVIDHNTVFQTGNIMMGYGNPHTNFVYTNNITGSADYGFTGDNTSEGIGALTTYFPNYQFQKNVVTGRVSSRYPIGNFFPSSMDGVGYMDLAGGNYQLSTASLYKYAGTDGKDIGADYNQITTTTANVITGQNSRTTTPPPAPTGTIYSLPASVTFGQTTVGQISPSQRVSLYNDTSTTINFSHKITGDFKVSEDYCNVGAQPATHCDVNVVFAPTGSGTRTGLLSFTLIDGSIYSTALTGTGIATTSTNNLPVGNFDEILSSGVAKGWSYDPDLANDSNYVHIYIDGPPGQGTLAAGIPANLLRSDVNTFKGISGNHGFEYTIPEIYRNNIAHTMYIYGIDLNDATKSSLLIGSPKTFTLGTEIIPPAPLPPSPSQLYEDGTLIKDSTPPIYILEYGQKRPFSSMTVFSGLGFSLKNVQTLSDLSYIPSGDPITTSQMRHTRGVKVSSKGTVYYMGVDLRYPYPSIQVYKSWNSDNFKTVVNANSYDLAVQEGPIVQQK